MHSDSTETVGAWPISLKRQRDAAQAQAVAALTTRYLLHLPFDMSALRMIPREVADKAVGELGVGGAGKPPLTF